MSLIGKSGGEQVTNSEFEKLYQNNFHIVYHYLLKLCQDECLAEEITSEVFFKAIHSINKFDGKCNVSTWLCQIAKNSYYSYLRKHKCLAEFNFQTEQEDTNMNIEKQVMDRILSNEIHKIVHKLEEPYQKVFILRIYHEFSFKQIGTVFGKSENWACVTYHRAKNKICARMEE